MMSFGFHIAATALTGLLIGPSGPGAPPPATTAAEQNADRAVSAAKRDAIEAEQREREQAQRDREREREQAQAEREASRKEREEQLYEDGQDALEDAKWQRAVERFSMVAAAKAPRADAALYWKAYALDKLGQKAEALATAAEMIKGYPSSRWVPMRRRSNCRCGRASVSRFVRRPRATRN